MASRAMTPNALAEYFHGSRQAVSKHIKVLAKCQLVNQEQYGREIYYQLNAKKLKDDKLLPPFRTQWEINSINRMMY